MKITFKDIDLGDPTSSIPAALHKSASKLTVRECDEEEPGRYVAYVDEGEESRDVQLRVDAEGRISTLTCDCGKPANGLCVHKAAMVMHVSQLKSGRKAGRKSGKAGVARKQDLFETLLETANPEALRNWLSGILRKDKQLQLSFIQAFSTETRRYTCEDTTKSTIDGRKAVLKNRVKADVSEVKKLVDLWQKLHEPILGQYLSDPTDTQAFGTYLCLVAAIRNQHFEIRTGSNRLVKYLTETIAASRKAIELLQSEDAWMRSLELHVQAIMADKHEISTLLIQNLLSMQETSDAARWRHVAGRLLHTFEKYPEAWGFQSRNLQEGLIKGLSLAGLFKENHEKFKPYKYEYEYNLTLLDSLVQDGLLDKAEQIAIEQMKANTKENYNLGYLLILKRIYGSNGSSEKLDATLLALLPHSYSYEDYLVLKGTRPDAGRSMQLTKVLQMVIARGRLGDWDAQGFCYQVLAGEGRYADLITLLEEFPFCYSLLIEGFEKMFEANEARLLEMLLRRDDRSYMHDQEEQLSLNYQQMMRFSDMMLARYGKERVKSALESLYRKRKEFIYFNILVPHLIREVKMGF